MFVESAYSTYENEEFQLNNTIPYKNQEQTGIVNSCGHYKFITRDNFKTYRPNGLNDCQLIYVEKGCGTFVIDGKEQLVKEGHVVLYYPLEPQQYTYQLCHSPEVYWIHFQYEPLKEFMTELGIDGMHCFEIGTSHECASFMKKIILELQQKKPFYQSICETSLRTMLASIGRSRIMDHSKGDLDVDYSMEEAIQYFHHKYNQPITIADLCSEYCMNEQWFRKKFKAYTGLSPKRFLQDIRIKKSMEFMQNTNLNFTEIASLVGYTDSLYFSRIFHSYTGKSPRDYRHSLLNQTGVD